MWKPRANHLTNKVSPGKECLFPRNEDETNHGVGGRGPRTRTTTTRLVPESETPHQGGPRDTVCKARRYPGEHATSQRTTPPHTRNDHNDPGTRTRPQDDDTTPRREVERCHASPRVMLGLHAKTHNMANENAMVCKKPIDGNTKFPYLVCG